MGPRERSASVQNRILQVGSLSAAPGEKRYGVNELTVGFAVSILGACVTYVVGVSAATRARAAPKAA